MSDFMAFIRQHWLAVTCVAAAALVASLVVLSKRSGSGNPQAAAPTPPALPCPSSGQTVDTKATTLPTTTSPGVSWAGVFERIFVKTDMNGEVSKTPVQHTLVAASGQGTTTIDVPMSSSHLRHSRGKKPKVVDGVAHVELNLNRQRVQRLKSDYDHPLPVSVKVTYKLNGQPISASEVKGKNGKVEIDYQLTNTTASPVRVCFKGFNGKDVEQTVTQPAPIYAYVYLTLPKHVTQFAAPGSFMNADRKGVAPQWLIALFKPLGPTKQTLKLTMDMKKVKIPDLTVLLEFVVPESLTGSAPAQSAAAVGRAQADVAAATAKVQADVAALTAKSSKPRPPRSTSGRGGSPGGKSSTEQSTSGRGGPSGGKSSPASAPGRSSDASNAAFTQLQAQIGKLGRANRNFLNALKPAEAERAASTDRSISGLTASTGRSIDALTASTSRSIDRLTAGTSRSIDDVTRRTSRRMKRLAADLQRSIDASSLASITARAGRMQKMALAVGALAGRLVPEVTALAGRAQNLLAALPTPVANASRAYLWFGQLGQDLDAFPPAVQATPEFLKLKADLTTGQALAKTVTDSLSQIQTEAQAVVAQAQTLQRDVKSLQAKLGVLAKATVTSARNTTQAILHDSVHGLDARFAADIATATRGVAGFRGSAQQQLAAVQADADAGVAAAGQSAHQALTSASDQFGQAITLAVRNAEQSLAADERKVNRALASAQKKTQAALAKAEANIKSGGQADVAAAQASAAHADAIAQNALTTANNDYARLLGLNQQAVAWSLPGGNATNVTEQAGSFIYTIAGTGR